MNITTPETGLQTYITTTILLYSRPETSRIFLFYFKGGEQTLYIVRNTKLPGFGHNGL